MTYRLSRLQMVVSPGRSNTSTMKQRSAIASVSLAISSLFFTPIAAQANGDWLDQSSGNWNRRFATEVPQAPSQSATNLTNCAAITRRATLPEDRSLQVAGWTLYGHAQVFGSTKVISAMTDADGMCRPLNYQIFVFSNGNFIGTLSPRAMNSRTDGSLISFNLYRENYIVATFNRYTSEDPLCCPSKRSRIIYQIESIGNQPALIPQLPGETSSANS